jgi:hypothetical protein
MSCEVLQGGHADFTLPSDYLSFVFDQLCPEGNKGEYVCLGRGVNPTTKIW